MRAVQTFLTIFLILFVSVITAMPANAKFLSTDPIGYEDQMNLYAYVGNDPVNHRDPTGLFCETCPPILTPALFGEDASFEKHREIQMGWAKGSALGASLLAAPVAIKGCAAGGCAAIGSGVNTLTLIGYTRAPTLFTSVASGTTIANGIANPGSQSVLSIGSPTAASLAARGFENVDIDGSLFAVKAYTTKSGHVFDFSARVTSNGSHVNLSNIGLFPGNGNLAPGVSAIREVRSQVLDDFSAMGFDELTATWNRISGANIGRSTTITKAIGPQ